SPRRSTSDGGRSGRSPVGGYSKRWLCRSRCRFWSQRPSCTTSRAIPSSRWSARSRSSWAIRPTTRVCGASTCGRARTPKTSRWWAAPALVAALLAYGAYDAAHAYFVDWAGLSLRPVKFDGHVNALAGRVADLRGTGVPVWTVSRFDHPVIAYAPPGRQPLAQA